jgi:hypothetical protein
MLIFRRSKSYFYSIWYIYYRIKELCIKLVIKTSIYYDAQSEKHHIFLPLLKLVVKKLLELHFEKKMFVFHVVFL